MIRTFNNFLKDRTGATAVEYALIVALLAAVIVTAVSTLGTAIRSSFGDVATTLNDPDTALGQ